MAASRAVMPPWMLWGRAALSNTCGACWFVMVRCRPAIGAWLTSSAGPQPSPTASTTPSTASCSNGFSGGTCCGTLRSASTPAAPLGHGPYQRAKQRLTVAAAFLAWLASRGHQLGECTQHDLDSWFAAGPSTRQHALTFLSWARRQRILRGIELPVIHTEAASPPPAPAVRLAAIRRLLLDDGFALEDRIAGCLVVLYGQQASRIAALRVSEVSCTDAATRLKLGADWLDVPEPVATLLRHHLRNRSNMTTAANPASPWLFPGQLAGEHRSYRRLIVILSRLGIPARASRLAAWHQLVRQAPPAVLADALGVSPNTATRHALLAGADWATYATRRPSLTTPEYDGLPVVTSSPASSA
jgi:hypothetical protein